MAHWLERVGLSSDLDNKDLFKIMLLSLAFFCVIGAYTVLKEFKDILFAQFVGNDALGLVKTISMFVLIPATLLYAKLVDSMTRFQLLCFYSGLYGVVGLIIAYLLADPVIGLPNAVASHDRWFGWFIYLFYEGCVPFVVSLFWSFSNSVTSPETAKKGYALMIAGSKLGGVFTAGVAWMLLTPTSMLGNLGLSDVFIHQLILSFASVMLCVAPVIIYYLLQSGNKENLHGYEAAYQAEKKDEEQGTDKTGMFSGISMMIRQPYILGIFAIIFFYELLNVVIAFQRIAILKSSSDSINDFSSAMFANRVFIQFTGFFIAFFGTRILLKVLGERICLLLTPILIGLLLIYFMINPTSGVLVAFTGLSIINYAFASPLRESLYIPTVKDIKYKSKSWIDSFGTKISKFASAQFITFARTLSVGSLMFNVVYISFFSSIIGLWILVAWWLGKRYTQAIEKNEVIGLD
ncbi:MAG: NTP/NDP exchange transporter [Candidatus Chromulinivorax sp.]